MAIATASPKPNRLTTRWSLSRKLRKTTTITEAAAVITRAVAATPLATEAPASSVRRNSSRTRLSRNTS